jgi:hypothetical protein
LVLALVGIMVEEGVGVDALGLKPPRLRASRHNTALSVHDVFSAWAIAAGFVTTGVLIVSV